jgi:sugar lactone lactonase YvrE
MKTFTAVETPAPRALFGEGPVWHNGALWFCDMPTKSVVRFDPATGASERRSFPVLIACLASTQGGLLAGTSDGFAFLPDAGGLEPLEDLLLQRPEHRMNDATTDRQGRFIAGSMSTPPDPTNADGRLWVLGKGHGSPHDFLTPNGLAVSPDGTILYMSDSHPSVQMVWRAAYNPATGKIGARVPWIDFSALPGRPDGAAIDRDGGYWIACIDAGRVCRYAPDGTLTAVVHAPVAKTTKPAFGGENMSTLFITTAQQDCEGGGLYSVEVPWQGIATQAQHS